MLKQCYHMSNITETSWAYLKWFKYLKTSPSGIIKSQTVTCFEYLT
ncbi:hypothetical protein CoNPh17_CDS0138 [Staphylococcus phage S-CoN_Ph17]|nr:hypothetical protein CoNPh17_CDS0138 [Staphylococcus phage S-CoN_Ph17]